MEVVFNVVYVLCQVLTWAIIIRVILSWFSIRPDNPLIIILDRITEPIISPLRRIVPRIGLIDVTPMVAIILLWIIIRALAYFV